jgi:hypothetical protein
MDTVCFSPTLDEINKSIWLLILLGIIGLTLLILVKSGRIKVIPKYKHLFLLLGGFILIISLGLSTFSFWTKSKITTICFHESHFTFSGMEYDYANIEKVYLFQDRQKEGLIQVGEPNSFLLLIIETSDRRQHVLSEVNYNVNELMTRFTEKLKEK